jgi:putative salt-induced outer membrane protein YdiY
MPWTYIPLDGWVNTAEFGVNGAAGNSDSFAMQAGSRFKRKTKATVFELKMTHNRAKANSIETQNNSLLFADWERLSNNSPWTLFSKFGLEADEFRAFDIRLNVNGGVGYQWISTDALTFKTRFGSGVSREFGGPDNAWKPEAVFGATYEHQVTKRHKLLGKIDYYPNWGNFADYRVVADAGWEYLLDDDGNLSFKLGMTDRYDSTPNGLNPNDINYNALLLYKF